MFVPLQWLVLFFFLILAIVFFLVYEIRAKFNWKEEAHTLLEKNSKLKIKAKNKASLLDEYSAILENLKKRLTERQFEVFLYTIDGLSSKDIGEKLHISPSTIDWHIKDIKSKLNVEKRSQFAGILLDELKQSLKKVETNKESEFLNN
jgi:DNA-binding CsgD family transcriptional regulator